jgi:Ca-activated chloride channel homolog
MLTAFPTSSNPLLDKTLTKFLELIQQLLLSCILPVVEFFSVPPRGRPARSGNVEEGVKRDLPRFRFLFLAVITCLFVFCFVLPGSMPARAQDDSAAPIPPLPPVNDEPAAKADPKSKDDVKPKEDAKPKDEDKSRDDAVANEDAKPKDANSIKKDTPGISIKPTNGLHMNVDLALVNVTVTDPYNRLVTGLDPDNFRVYEDNIEQEVVTFSSEDVPISIGVIFDFSGSMANKVGKAREAAVQFFKTANPQDEFFLVSFNERAELTSAFTNSIEDLQSRMMLTAPKGRTALLDAIYLGLSQMRGARNAKRALLILSDGGDNHSRYNESDIKRLVREADTQLYAIGIFDPLGFRNRTPEELNGPSLLNEVTEMTGGRVFAVENLNELPDIASKIGMELRNQYVLGYRPSNKAHDARWRKIKIKLRAPKGLPPLNVYSKTGYYAPSH